MVRLSQEEARRILGDKIAGKKQKFNRPPTSALRFDGFLFDSKAEVSRYGYLKILEQAGRISELSVHPTFPIEINGHHICDVELDFRYAHGDRFVFEDVKVKATNTALSRLKRKLLWAVKGIAVTLVAPPRKGWGGDYG